MSGRWRGSTVSEAEVPGSSAGDASWEQRLPRLASAVPAARRLVAGWLRAAGGPDELVADAEVVATELVTNAVLHSAGDHLHLRLIAVDEVRRLEVEDHYPGLPATRPRSDSGVGHGLQLLEALATESGVTPTDGGKVVWATFPSRTQDAPSGDGPLDEASQPLTADVDAESALRAETDRFRGATTRPDAEDEQLAEVRLLGLPLAAFAAQLSRHRELLRELELVSRAPGRPGAPGLQELARELTRYRGMGESTEAARAAASARGERTLDVVYRLPRTAGVACARMIRLLAQADTYAQEGALLALPATPLDIAVREWFLCQITDQCNGAAPLRWTGPLEGPSR
jgi:anti-sigma regulatory factor (Ser/Thr protein kinase)